MSEAEARPWGRLVVVATPIGNLGDLSPRAVEALRSADVLACEDTRRTGRLLQHAGVSVPRMAVVNEHTERAELSRLMEMLADGKVVVLVSDAGMPGVSDPGERLVAAAVAQGFPVEVVPGPSALITALVVSGLPTSRFCFEGFLPRKGAERQRRLAAVAGEERTSVLYEAPHRLERTLAELAAAAGEQRRVAIARELTKLHEEVWRGTLAGAAKWAAASPPRGEFVIVIEGAPPPGVVPDGDLVSALGAERDAGSSTRDAVAAVAERFGVARRRVYDLAHGR